jgi:hypothetical protein
VAEWPNGLGKGLQSPVHGFDSRLRLQRTRHGIQRPEEAGPVRFAAVRDDAVGR